MEPLEKVSIHNVSETADELAKKHADAVDEAHRYEERLYQKSTFRMCAQVICFYVAVLVLLVVNLVVFVAFVSNTSKQMGVDSNPAVRRPDIEPKASTDESLLSPKKRAIVTAGESNNMVGQYSVAPKLTAEQVQKSLQQETSNSFSESLRSTYDQAQREIRESELRERQSAISQQDSSGNVLSHIQSNALLVKPGSSVGQTVLGMTRSAVIDARGKPTSEFGNGILIYRSSKSDNFLALRFRNEVLESIAFTSSDFSTADGINLESFDDPIYRNKFQLSEMWDGSHLFMLNTGGFAIVSVSPEWRRVGVVGRDLSNLSWVLGACSGAR